MPELRWVGPSKRRLNEGHSWYFTKGSQGAAPNSRRTTIGPSVVTWPMP